MIKSNIFEWNRTTNKFTIRGFEALHTGNLGSLGVGKLLTGEFIGDGQAYRFINVGVTPKYVLVGDDSYFFIMIGYKTGAMRIGPSTGFITYAQHSLGIEDLGFSVNANIYANSSGRNYKWIVLT